MTTLRFVSWNIGRPSAQRLARQMRFLSDLEPDVVALQEVSAANVAAFAELSSLTCVGSGVSIRPQGPGETNARDRGCAIVIGRRVQPGGHPSVLDDSAAPERSVWLPIEIDGRTIDVASFHQVAGSDRKKWGPAKKAQSFRAFAEWMSAHSTSATVGMDLNSPLVDHPDVSRNVYFHGSTPGDQKEHLVHDPTRSSHGFRDAYRLCLAEHPDEFAEILRHSPEGPLATSHIVRGKPRRFDFVYVTPDLEVSSVIYETGVLSKDSPSGRLADHAAVIAEIEVS